MRALTLSQLMLACGAAGIVVGLGLALSGAPGAARAQGLPPRPTVAPTDVPPDPGHHPTPVLPGHITGTVIDERTGAPAPGVAVQVGAFRLASDAHGNYDRNGLTPGSYQVALALAEGQGTATQGALTVAVAAGQTVVQHLSFRSPEPAVALVVAPPPTPAQIPVALPATGAGDDTAAALSGLGALLLGAGLVIRRVAR